MGKRIVILLAVMGLMMALVAGVAFAVVKTGDNGPNVLNGTAENDTLRGLGGNDRLDGRGDSDRLFGGGGNDVIRGREVGEQDGDRIDCGPGRDTVITDNSTEDIILGNCEVIQRG